MSGGTVEVPAPAKLTISLRVTGVRPDGYHLLDAEMVTLDLGDTLTITEGPVSEVHLAGAVAGLDAGTGEDNLVLRALRAVGRTATVHLHKRIPAGAGLGGGSADAAAVLRWAGVTADAAGCALAVSLGADVPFCLHGGRARVGGIGEELQPLGYQARAFTLLTPPFGCATPAVYRAWDALGGPRSEGPNDLEAAALAVEPRLAVWRDRLGDRSGQTPVLAGSGSTWFVEGEYEGECEGQVLRIVHTVS